MQTLMSSFFRITQGPAKRVCDYMSRQLKQPVAKEEIGFLAIHIQRVISPDTV